MADPRPLLFFPRPVAASTQKANPFPRSGPQHPNRARQGVRLEPQFQALQRIFEQKLAQVATDPTGVAPEQVLVFETIGDVEDFRKAAERAGLEWMGEFDAESVPPDEDFFEKNRPERPVPRRLYITIANQNAMGELLSLWTKWKQSGKDALPLGKKKWSELLDHLRDVRRWGPKDRIEDSGLLTDWEQRIADGFGVVRFQAELWYRSSAATQQAAAGRVRTLVARAQGRVIADKIIDDIAYHGILAELPVATVKAILASPDTELVLAEDVMFYRPCGQGVDRGPSDAATDRVTAATLPLPTGDPVVALLDGIPIDSHDLLDGRVDLDDPDDWATTAIVEHRRHGTAMASLIVRGDLAERGPALGTPLLVRPVLRHDSRYNREVVPEELLTLDVIHRAVIGIVDRAAGGSAPSVRVINLSVGDPHYPFHGFVSPWARLLDWLAWKYGVLFVVSAGNNGDQLVLEVPVAVARTLSERDLTPHVLSAVARDARHRLIYSPAEALNALTVGAAYSDATMLDPSPNTRLVLDDPQLPSPISRMGLGYRRGIKPDLLAPGGRAWYRERPNGNPSTTCYELVENARAGGQVHAYPGPGTSPTSHVAASVGTSNAAALCTRHLGLANETLAALLDSAGYRDISPAHHALLLRCIAAHTADWSKGRERLAPILRAGGINPNKIREHVARFLGYGVIRADRMVSCTAQRATALGFSSLANDKAHEYRFPLPPSLEGIAQLKRLTVTLTWFTPINPRHKGYRSAALWLDLPNLSVLAANRTQADVHAALRGTIQHEVFEGSKAAVYSDDDDIVVRVSCQADAGPLSGEVPYAIACSLEIAEGVAVPIYDEVRARLAARIPVVPQA